MRPQQQTELAQTIPSQNPEIDAMASTGRKGDTMMAHVTPGDYVIPKDILVQHPDFLVKLKKVMSDENEDYRSHMVGSGFENINPETGSPEFGFIKKIKQFTGNIGQAVGGLTGSKSLGRAAAIGTGFAAGAPLGIFGAIPGAMAGNSGYSGVQRQQTDLQNKAGGYNAGYEAGTQIANNSIGDMALPGSLQELGGLTDEQKRSYLATQGAQGEGLGGSSRDYYINLLQRNIRDNPQANLLPVESQYLSQNNINNNLRGNSLINALRGF